MAKIKTLKPLVSTMKPRLTVDRKQQEAVRLRERDQNTEWRAWYKTSKWQRLREQVLVRDGYKCQRTGVLLIGKHPAPNSPVVDHIKPHRGDAALFWDMDNLQSVSKEYHDSIKQAQERADKVAAIHPKWLQPSFIPLTIVCGPAGSGKSTYVARNKGPFDLVIDLDVIASEISGEPTHGWDRDKWLNAALYRRNDMLGSLSRPSNHRAAWFIVAEPKAKHRDWWQQTLKPEAIIVLEVDEPTCMAQASRDPDRDMARTEQAITNWWANYEPRIGDRVIRGAINRNVAP
ncbi:5-methylcytosine-specific restriction endonuclease McrA [Ochrobactrum daejeonense]|uniref:5-methylcytosine-specific restriction endonuclease McrA n=1 Tax=Brucella daejeonensis TaxID=659015 RepID=A0A7W9B131_9HYPH|nr:AAA family ATPase [Brucella daejeonensis]MBB5704300.1 5-methylcytosine-specific restriction endonuclease McrA [Brucella daejeonensis]NKB78563.1 AAA family ATPase [Brucella daejeonensis]